MSTLQPAFPENHPEEFPNSTNLSRTECLDGQLSTLHKFPWERDKTKTDDRDFVPSVADLIDHEEINFADELLFAAVRDDRDGTVNDLTTSSSSEDKSLLSKNSITLEEHQPVWSHTSDNADMEFLSICKQQVSQTNLSSFPDPVRVTDLDLETQNASKLDFSDSEEELTLDMSAILTVLDHDSSKTGNDDKTCKDIVEISPFPSPSNQPLDVAGCSKDVCLDSENLEQNEPGENANKTVLQSKLGHTESYETDCDSAVTICAVTSTQATNSTVTNSAVINSEVTNSSSTNSAVTNSEVTNSSSTNSAVTNSLSTNSAVTNSLSKNSAVTKSAATNPAVSCVVANTAVTDTTATVSATTDSAVTNSDVRNSKVSNSAVTSDVENSCIAPSFPSLIDVYDADESRKLPRIYTTEDVLDQSTNQMLSDNNVAVAVESPDLDKNNRNIAEAEEQHLLKAVLTDNNICTSPSEKLDIVNELERGSSHEKTISGKLKFADVSEDLMCQATHDVADQIRNQTTKINEVIKTVTPADCQLSQKEDGKIEDEPITISDSEEELASQVDNTQANPQAWVIPDRSCQESDVVTTTNAQSTEIEYQDDDDDVYIVESDSPKVITIESSDEDEVETAPEGQAKFHRRHGLQNRDPKVNDQQANKVQFACQICSEHQTSLTMLRLHVRRKHNLLMVHSKEEMKCNLCNFRSTWQNIKDHIITGHKTPLKWFVKSQKVTEVTKLPVTESQEPVDTTTRRTVVGTSNLKGSNKQQYLIKKVSNINQQVTTNSVATTLVIGNTLPKTVPASTLAPAVATQLGIVVRNDPISMASGDVQVKNTPSKSVIYIRHSLQPTKTLKTVVPDTSSKAKLVIRHVNVPHQPIAVTKQPKVVEQTIAAARCIPKQNENTTLEHSKTVNIRPLTGQVGKYTMSGTTPTLFVRTSASPSIRPGITRPQQVVNRYTMSGTTQIVSVLTSGSLSTRPGITGPQQVSSRYTMSGTTPIVSVLPSGSLSTTSRPGITGPQRVVNTFTMSGGTTPVVSVLTSGSASTRPCTTGPQRVVNRFTMSGTTPVVSVLTSGSPSTRPGMTGPQRVVNTFTMSGTTPIVSVRTTGTPSTRPDFRALQQNTRIQSCTRADILKYQPIESTAKPIISLSEAIQQSCSVKPSSVHALDTHDYCVSPHWSMAKQQIISTSQEGKAATTTKVTLVSASTANVVAAGSTISTPASIPITARQIKNSSEDDTANIVTYLFKVPKSIGANNNPAQPISSCEGSRSFIVRVPANKTNSSKKFMVYLPADVTSDVKHAVCIVQPPTLENVSKVKGHLASVGKASAVLPKNLKSKVSFSQHRGLWAMDTPLEDLKNIEPLIEKPSRGDIVRNSEWLAHLNEPPVDIALLRSKFESSKVFQAADLIKCDDRVQYECARCKQAFPQLMLLKLHHIDCTAHPVCNKVLPIIHIPTALLTAFFNLSSSGFSSMCTICNKSLLGSSRSSEDQQEFASHLSSHAEPEVAITCLDDSSKLGIRQTRLSLQQGKEWVDYIVKPFKMKNKPTSSLEGTLEEYVCTEGELHRQSVTYHKKKRRHRSSESLFKKHKKHKHHPAEVLPESSSNTTGPYQSSLKTMKGCEGEWIEPSPKRNSTVRFKRKPLCSLRESIIKSPPQAKLMPQCDTSTNQRIQSKNSRRLSLSIPGRRSKRGQGLDFGMGLVMLPMENTKKKKKKKEKKNKKKKKKKKKKEEKKKWENMLDTLMPPSRVPHIMTFKEGVQIGQQQIDNSNTKRMTIQCGSKDATYCDNKPEIITISDDNVDGDSTYSENCTAELANMQVSKDWSHETFGTEKNDSEDESNSKNSELIDDPEILDDRSSSHDKHEAQQDIPLSLIALHYQRVNKGMTSDVQEDENLPDIMEPRQTSQNPVKGSVVQEDRAGGKPQLEDTVDCSLQDCSSRSSTGAQLCSSNDETPAIVECKVQLTDCFSHLKSNITAPRISVLLMSRAETASQINTNKESNTSRVLAESIGEVMEPAVKRQHIVKYNDGMPENYDHTEEQESSGISEGVNPKRVMYEDGTFQDNILNSGLDEGCNIKKMVLRLSPLSDKTMNQMITSVHQKEDSYGCIQGYETDVGDNCSTVKNDAIDEVNRHISCVENESFQECLDIKKNDSGLSLVKHTAFDDSTVDKRQRAVFCPNEKADQEVDVDSDRCSSILEKGLFSHSDDDSDILLISDWELEDCDMDNVPYVDEKTLVKINQKRDDEDDDSKSVINDFSGCSDIEEGSYGIEEDNTNDSLSQEHNFNPAITSTDKDSQAIKYVDEDVAPRGSKTKEGDSDSLSKDVGDKATEHVKDAKRIYHTAESFPEDRTQKEITGPCLVEKVSATETTVDNDSPDGGVPLETDKQFTAAGANLILNRLPTCDVPFLMEDGKDDHKSRMGDDRQEDGQRLFLDDTSIGPDIPDDGTASTLYSSAVVTGPHQVDNNTQGSSKQSTLAISQQSEASECSNLKRKSHSCQDDRYQIKHFRGEHFDTKQL